MWDIYLDNPNSYKIRRFESKRIQQIDRKLKQYYNEKGDNKDHYKTIDLSQLDRSKAKYENSSFLLKDVSKFEQQNTIHPNSSLVKDSKNQHVNLNNIWNNQGNNTNYNKNNNINSNYTNNINNNNSNVNPSLNLTSNRNSFTINNTNINNNKNNDSNRFKIEKIKDIV
jgi:hypothetical protein